MAVALPENVYIYLCTIPPDGGTSPFPTGCEIRGPFKSSVLQEDVSGWTQVQVDEVLGGIIGLIVTIIIFALLKKAIES